MKICRIAVVVAVVALFAALLKWSAAERPAAHEGGGGDAAAVVAERTANRQVASRRQSVTARSKPPRAKPVLGFGDDGVEDDELKSADKALASRIEKALDDEDFEAAAACAGEALKCKVAEVRQAMVDTLGWFGKKALPELAPFLADSDSDVRESAMTEWSMAVSSIEDESERLGTVELAIGILRDEDSLEELSNEYIGVDEKLAVESLARIICGSGSKEGIEKAKETYEFVTGNEWAGVEDAARWIAEEYKPEGAGG